MPSLQRLLTATPAVFALAITASAAPAQAVPEGAGECVRFEVVRVEPEIAYSVANQCTVSVACTVTWRLVCGENRDGRTVNGRHSMRLARETANEFAVDTSACGDQDWSVEDVAWSCAK